MLFKEWVHPYMCMGTGSRACTCMSCVTCKSSLVPGPHERPGYEANVRVAHTYSTSQVGIILVGLAYRIVVCNKIVAITEVVGIVITHKIHSTILRSSIIAISLWTNITYDGCEVNTRSNKVNTSTDEILYFLLLSANILTQYS